MTTLEKKITGVFVSLDRKRIRVVIKRKIDVWRDSYDVYKPQKKIDVVVEVLQVLLNEIPDFIQKILAVDEGYYKKNLHRKRHYIHTEKEKLYESTRTDLAKKYSRKIGNVWLGTNIGTSQMLQIIREACEAAGIQYGSLRSFEL